MHRRRTPGCECMSYRHNAGMSTILYCLYACGKSGWPNLIRDTDRRFSIDMYTCMYRRMSLVSNDFECVTFGHNIDMILS